MTIFSLAKVSHLDFAVHNTYLSELDDQISLQSSRTWEVFSLTLNIHATTNSDLCF